MKFSSLFSILATTSALSLSEATEQFATLYQHYFEHHFFNANAGYVDKIDVEDYLKTNPVIKEWDNTLPTLIYHGINDNCDDGQINNFIKVIGQVGEANGKQLHAECMVIGGTQQNFESIFESMAGQTAEACKTVQEHPIFGKSDFNLVGISQGGMLTRGMIQDCDLGEHKVRNYLSIAGPQMGVQKTPSCLDGVLCDILTWVEDHIAFFSVAQEHLAPAAYWRDTYSEKYFDQYLKYSAFLAPINNERQHEKSAQYKERFSALNRLELVKFQNDTIVYPKESEWFGTYNVGNTEITAMKDTKVYKEDTVGLKTLDD